MRRRIVTSLVALLTLAGIGAAQAQSATVCASATVVVNGDALVDQADCVVVPPAE